MEPVLVYFTLALCVALLSLVYIIFPVILDSKALGSTVSNQHPYILSTILFILAFILAPFVVYLYFNREILKQVHVGLVQGLSE